MKLHRNVSRAAVTATAVALALTGCQALTGNDPAGFSDDASGVDADAAENDTDENDTDELDTDENESSGEDGPDAAGDHPSPEADDDGAESSDGQAVNVEAPHIRGPEEALRAMTYDVPDTRYEVTVGLHTLRVEGDVMRLELSFTPEGNSNPQGIYHFNQSRGLAPLLHDRENFKQYQVIGGPINPWASGSGIGGGTRVASGETVMYYAYYSAPQDDIDTLDISVIEGLVEFHDVEIEK